MDLTCKTHTNQKKKNKKTLRWNTVNPVVPEAGAPVVSSGILLQSSPLKSDSVFFFFIKQKVCSLPGLCLLRSVHVALVLGELGQEGGWCRSLPSQQHEHGGDFVQLGAVVCTGGIFPGLNAERVCKTWESQMQIRDALGKCLFACRETQQAMFGKLSLGGEFPTCSPGGVETSC